MKRSEAPRPGWYPDPVGGTRLRWWDGEDWTDRYRARPIPAAGQIPAPLVAQSTAMQEGEAGWITDLPGVPSQAANLQDAQIIEQLRRAAREEAQRASVLFGQQARAATRNIQPLITEYTSKISRLFKFLTTVAIILLVLWVLFQVFAQQSMWDWFGDRIDNLTDDSSPGALGALAAVTRWR